MSRTTVDIDDEVLRALRRRQQQEGKSLGRLVSELLSGALEATAEEPQPLELPSQSMGAKVDIDDKDALWRALDGR